MIASHNSGTQRSSPDPCADFVRVQNPVLGNLGSSGGQQIGVQSGGFFGNLGGGGINAGQGGGQGPPSIGGPGSLVNVGGAPSIGYETSEFCEVKTHSYSEPVSVDELEAILRDWNIEDNEAQVLGQ